MYQAFSMSYNNELKLKWKGNYFRLSSSHNTIKENIKFLCGNNVLLFIDF